MCFILKSIHMYTFVIVCPFVYIFYFFYPKAATIPSAQSLRILEFSFSDFDLSEAETTQATIRMFVDLKLVQNFQMKYKVRAPCSHRPSMQATE